jgi:hypothetical protein
MEFGVYIKHTCVHDRNEFAVQRVSGFFFKTKGFLGFLFALAFCIVAFSYRCYKLWLTRNYLHQKVV